MTTTARVLMAVPGSSGPWIADEMTMRSLLPFREIRARPAEKREY
jgi:hypothetical protein